MNDTNKRCGYVYLLGAPNAGKSTLVNRLTGAKISIVTHKAQTTRARVIGIFICGFSQILLVDTPGIFEPRRGLERAMVSSAWSGVAEADIRIILVDASNPDFTNVNLIINQLSLASQTAVLAINKIDKVKRSNLLSIVAKLNSNKIFSDTFLISGLNGDGVKDLEYFLKNTVPCGRWLYPASQISDMNDRLFAAEITREKLFLQLHEELPYSLTVETESWQERKDGSIRIEQVVYVTRPGHRGILLGRGGQQVKRIGAAARRELEKLLKKRVHLFIFVKVNEKWLNDERRYRAIGLNLN